MGDIKLAKAITESFLQDGLLSPERCPALNIEQGSCTEINDIISDGRITADERPRLKTAFTHKLSQAKAEKLIVKLAGADGNRLLYKGVKHWSNILAEPKLSAEKMIEVGDILWKFASEFKHIVPRLISELGNPSWKVRARAAAILAINISMATEEAKAAIPQLKKLLKDKKYQVRLWAVSALGSLLRERPALEQEMSPALVKALGDKHYKVRKRANTVVTGEWAYTLIDKLTMVNRELNYLNDTLSDSDENSSKDVKPLTLWADSMPGLIANLKHPNNEVKISAAEAIASISVEAPSIAKPAIPELLKLTSDRDGAVRLEAATTLLAFVNSDMPEVIKLLVPVFAKAFSDRDPEVRTKAVEGFEEIGLTFSFGRMDDETKEALANAAPKLIKALKDQEAEVSSLAAEAIAFCSHLLPEDMLRKSIPILKENLLVNKNSEAAYALGQIGQESTDFAQSVIPILKKAALDKGLRYEAIEALGHVALNSKTVKSIIPIFAEALRDKDPEVRSEAADGIKEIGLARSSIPVGDEIKEAFAKAAPQLIEALKDQEGEVSYSAARAIASSTRLLPKDTLIASIPILKEKLLVKKNLEAAYTLVQIGLLSKELVLKVVPILKKALSHEDEEVRKAAKEVIEDI